MSTLARRVHHSYAEYLALEEERSTRHEFLDGETAMASWTGQRPNAARLVSRHATPDPAGRAESAAVHSHDTRV